MMERFLTIILGEEKHKNDNGKSSHTHFQQRETEK